MVVQAALGSLATAISGGATLGDFLDRYIDGRTDVKPTTTTHLIRARRDLERFFGADRPLISITPGDADEYRRHLMSVLAENTARRLCGRAKQFFRAAVRLKVIDDNPFADMRNLGVRANKSREFFVDRELTAAAMAAMPDAEWRAIFALARFGGLRCPSEVLALDWSDVDWRGGKLRVPSPKTAYCGKGERITPLFPELREHLADSHEAAGWPKSGLLVPLRSRPHQRGYVPRSRGIDPSRAGMNLRQRFVSARWPPPSSPGPSRSRIAGPHARRSWPTSTRCTS